MKTGIITENCRQEAVFANMKGIIVSEEDAKRDGFYSGSGLFSHPLIQKIWPDFSSRFRSKKNPLKKIIAWFSYPYNFEDWGMNHYFYHLGVFALKNGKYTYIHAGGASPDLCPEMPWIYFFETETLEELAEKIPQEAAIVLRLNMTAQQIENSSKKEKEYIQDLVLYSVRWPKLYMNCARYDSWNGVFSPVIPVTEKEIEDQEEAFLKRKTPVQKERKIKSKNK